MNRVTISAAMQSTRSSLLPNCGSGAVAFIAVVDGETAVVADDADLPVFDGGEAVGDHRQAGDAERHRSQDVAVVQRHLEAFIEIFVMHVMDAVHRMHIGAREPFHGDVELREHFVIVEEFAGSPAATPARPVRPRSRRGRR